MTFQEYMLGRTVGYFGKGAGGEATSAKRGTPPGRRQVSDSCKSCVSRGNSCADCKELEVCSAEECKELGGKGGGYRGYFGMAQPTYLGPPNPAPLCPPGYFKMSGPFAPIPYCVKSSGTVSTTSPGATVEVFACESWFKVLDENGKCSLDPWKVGLAAVAGFFFLYSVAR